MWILWFKYIHTDYCPSCKSEQFYNETKKSNSHHRAIIVTKKLGKTRLARDCKYVSVFICLWISARDKKLKYNIPWNVFGQFRIRIPGENN